MSSAVWEAIAELIAKGGKEKTGEGQGDKREPMTLMVVEAPLG